jgi:branched-chain amino acid transport system ATP-binding protein
MGSSGTTRESAGRADRAAGGPAGPVLTVDALGWRVGGATIVEDVSLVVEEGEFLAVIGPNGAGKSSLFNLISGLQRPTHGTIALDGRDVTAAPAHTRARLGLGRTFQTSSLWPAMSVADHVRLAAQAAAGGSYRLWRRAAAYPERVESCLARTGLADRAETVAGALSHGGKRALEIAVLLAGDPRVLLLDEPMAGVSAEEVPALTELIRALHREEGRTVLMVEHHMDVLLGLADRVAVMHHGALLALDRPATVMADEAVQQAYLGEAL